MFVDLMRDKAKQMPVMADPLAIESLRIWHCSYTTLDPLTALKNLRALTIATFPDKSLDALGTLENLQELRILHLAKVDDLQPLAKLAHLESLALETLPSWDASKKRTVVASLEPLTHIPGLKHLSLIGVISSDRSLAVLERCKSLVSAIFHGYPKEEIARFFAVTGVENAHKLPFHAG